MPFIPIFHAPKKAPKNPADGGQATPFTTIRQIFSMTNKVQIIDNGPMQLTGNFELVDDNGEIVRARKIYRLCRCGLSARLPFCDSSHEQAGFSSSPRAPQAGHSADPAPASASTTPAASR
ncbi:MAG TPA: CDGSH iron-sulfur domain-containing protein [Paraburkholderia sp.]